MSATNGTTGGRGDASASALAQEPTFASNDPPSFADGSEIAAVEALHGAGFLEPRPVAFARGAGARLYDESGREYIDAAAAHGCASLGHAHPRVTAALAEQGARLIASTPAFAHAERAAYMRELAAVMPAGLERFFFCNSGAEAVEGALKIARLATGRRGVVACVRGFHGRTLGALSATWERHYREAFTPWLVDVVHVPHGRADALGESITEDTAAVVVEIVQGEGGVRLAAPEFLREAQRLCRENGAMLVVDEVQTGFGRTGRLFAFEHEGLEPDLVALAKGIAAGLPMGAVAIGPRVGTLPPGTHGSTFGGNPLACAVARVTLRTLVDEDLSARAARVGDAFRARLAAIDDPRIREVRGLGLMVGVELRVPAAPFVDALLERGVVALRSGKNVVRFLPPLVIGEGELALVADHFEEVLACV